MRPTAQELRKTARTTLKKRHWLAVLLTFITVWLGGTTFLPGPDPLTALSSFSGSGAAYVPYDFNSYDFGSTEPFYYHTAQVQTLFAMPEQTQGLIWLLPLVMGVLLLVLAVSALAFAVIFTGGPIRLGYSRWCLQMHDADSPRPLPPCSPVSGCSARAWDSTGGSI